MIIVQLIGGLGNQLFQYALGKKLAIKNNCDLLLDLRYLDNQTATATHTPRKLEIGYFNTNYKLLSNDLLKNISPSFDLMSRINTFIRTLGDIRKVKWEKSSFHPQILDVKAGSFLKGYFQDERYFKDIRDVLLKDIVAKQKPTDQNAFYLDKIINTESVAIHIRRGDYANNPHIQAHHGLLPLSYYQHAMKVISDRIQHPHFFVFSDDIEWARENIVADSPITFVSGNQGNTNYMDLELMRHCKHFIIANSSFSWWGAWLGTAEDKTVVAPKHWFNKEAAIELPEEWIRLE